MGYRLLRSEDAFWRPSNQMRVQNTDLGKQLEAETLGARLWRLAPGQASTRHRHAQTTELYCCSREPDGFVSAVTCTR